MAFKVSGGGPLISDTDVSKLMDTFVEFWLMNKNGLKKVEDERDLGPSFRDIYLTSVDLAAANEPVGFFSSGKTSILSANKHQIDHGFGLDDNDYIFDNSIGWA